MDDGLAAALLALGVGFPLLSTYLLFGSGMAVLSAAVMVGSVALAFPIASRVGDADGTDDGDPEADALAELRGRYARGELSEAEFERRVETLLRTETPADARDHVVGDVPGEDDDVPAEDDLVRER